MSLKNVLRIALLVCLAVLVLGMATCGGKKKHKTMMPAVGTDKPSLESYAEVSLDDALAQLDALQPPEEVDPALFETLKGALREALVARNLSKFVSAPPGENSRVTDLDLVDNWDGTYSLVWHYRNEGDYDQNGVVGISDITPIAMHFGESVPGGDDDTLLGVIDGSDNDVVDISDITPIAMGFGNEVDGYRAEGTQSLLEDWEWVDDVSFAGAKGAGRRYFDVCLNYIDYQTYHVVPYDSDWIDGEASNDTLSSHSVEVSGVVQWDTGGLVEDAHVTARTTDGSSAGEADTDASGGFMIELAPVAFNVKVVVQADYDDAATGLTLTNFRTTDELEQPGSVDSVVVTLPDPAGSELVIAGDHAESVGGDIILDGLPDEVQRVYARAYDPDVSPDSFPGDFEDSDRFALNSSAFMWITAQDGGGTQIDQLSESADVRLEVPPAQWGDLTDIFPGNGQIDVPIYNFDYETGFWTAKEDGYLVDETGAVIPEETETDITSGVYSGRIYARFVTEHFSYKNVDYPYVFVWTLSRMSPALRNSEYFDKALKLAERIAKSQKGRSAFAKVNKPGTTLESEYLTDGKPDNANKKAPEIRTAAMEWNQEQTKNGKTYKVSKYGEYWGRVKGRRQDEFFLNSKFWDAFGSESSEAKRNGLIVKLAATILHEFAHQKQHTKKQQPEPCETGWRLEKDIFDGKLGYWPDKGLELDGDIVLEEMVDVWLDPSNWPEASGGSSLRESSDVGDSGLEITISTGQAVYGTLEPVVVDITYTNAGTEPLDLLPSVFSVHYPLRFIITDEFEQPVDWIGPVYSLDIHEDSFVVLEPGEDISVSWDLRYDDQFNQWRYDLYDDGVYELTAVYSEFLPPYDPVESNTISIVVETQPPGSIAGTVRDADTSAGVPDATVRALIGSLCLGSTETIADGTYTLSGLQPVTYTVEAFAHNHALDTLESVEVISEQTTQPVDFELDAAQRGDWFMFGRDKMRQHRSPFVGAQTNNLKWRCQLGGNVSYSSPAIGADGNVYIGCDDYKLYAITPEGSVDWTYETGGNVETSPAIGHDGTIYFGSYDAYFYAVNPDGSFKWKYLLGEPDWHWVRSSPVVTEDGTIYVGGSDGYLYAFEPDGTLKWRYYASGAIYPGIAVGPDRTVYVSGWDDWVNHLHAVTPEGDFKWTYEIDRWVVSTPAVADDGTVYFGSDDGRIYALNPDGTLKWRVWGLEGSILGTRSSPAIAEDGTIYIGVNGIVDIFTNYLLALNPDGSVKWQALTASTVDAGPAIGADGVIYVGDINYDFKAYSPADGSVLWDYQTGDWIQTSAAIGEDGTVYVGCWDGYLYAFGN